MPEHIVLDIETVPDHDFLGDEAARAVLFSSVKAPKTYKDKAKIAAYEQEARDKIIRDAALSPVTGRIAAIGWAALDDLEPIGIVINDERAMIENFLDSMSRVPPHYIVCGFNCKRFDLVFLHYRCAVLGIRRVDRAALPIPNDWRRVFDLFDFVGREGPLKLHLRRMFGDDMMKAGEGADVMNMNPVELMDYVRQDVACTRELVRRFEWAIPSARNKKWD